MVGFRKDKTAVHNASGSAKGTRCRIAGQFVFVSVVSAEGILQLVISKTSGWATQSSNHVCAKIPSLQSAYWILLFQAVWFISFVLYNVQVCYDQSPIEQPVLPISVYPQCWLPGSCAKKLPTNAPALSGRFTFGSAFGNLDQLGFLILWNLISVTFLHLAVQSMWQAFDGHRWIFRGHLRKAGRFGVGRPNDRSKGNRQRNSILNHYCFFIYCYWLLYVLLPCAIFRNFPYSLDLDNISYKQCKKRKQEDQKTNTKSNRISRCAFVVCVAPHDASRPSAKARREARAAQRKDRQMFLTSEMCRMFPF